MMNVISLGSFGRHPKIRETSGLIRYWRLQQDIGPYHIIFKAVRGNWGLANIALDDIVIANSNCNGKYKSYRYTIYVCFYILM